MSSRCTRRGRSSSPRDGGASLVEFALIMPLLFLLLLGTFTGGLTLSRQNSVKNAVREGTRFGAIRPIDDSNPATTDDLRDYLNAVYLQVEAAATGDLDAGTPGKYICVAFITAGDVRSSKTDSSSSAPASSWCFDDGRTNQARVQVVARRQSEIEALFFTQNITLTSQSVTRYER